MGRDPGCGPGTACQASAETRGPALARIACDYGYTVDDLHINGGRLPTRHDAEQDCLSAIAFALEGNPADYDPTAETLTLDVTVAPAA